MDAIGKSQVNGSQLGGALGLGALADTPPPMVQDKGVTAIGNTPGLVPAGGLSSAAAAGTLGFSAASLDGVDWDQLAADITTTDTMNISISEIMVLLVKTMADLRKGQREAWMGEAQNALAMGLNAADRMRDSAAAKLACDCITNGTSIALACVSLGTQAATLAKEFAVGKQVAQEAGAKLAAQRQALGLPDEGVVADTPKLTGKVPELDDLDMPGVDGNQAWNDNPLYVKPDDAIKMAEPDPVPASVEVPKAQELAQTPQSQQPGDAAKATSAKGPAGDTAAKGADPKASDGFDAKKAQFQAKEQEIGMWETQRRAELMRPFTTRMEIINKSAEVLGGFSKMGASVGEYMSAIKQAEAQEARSRGEYANNIAQVELDFANELRDTMRTALDAMKSVESGRHQAMQGIFNI